MEGVIRELWKNWFCTMQRKRVPRRLWDYSLKWVSEVHVRTSSDAVDLKGRAPPEQISGIWLTSLSILTSASMIGVGTMTMQGWDQQNWAGGSVWCTKLEDSCPIGYSL